MIGRLIRWIRGTPRASFIARPALPPDPARAEGRVAMRLGDVLEGPAAARHRAESGLRREIDGILPGEWPRVDERLRGWRHLDEYAEIPEDVVIAPGSAAAEVLASHGNGLIRAEMVRRLAEQRDGRELRPLLLRARDWVPQVRDAAREALRGRVGDDYAVHWARNLALVLWVRGGERGDPELAERVMELLASDRAEHRMFSCLESPERQVRRAAFELLTRHDGPRRFGRVRIALGCRDVGIRRRAAGWVGTFRQDGQRALLPLLLADPAPVIRTAGLDVAVHALGPGERDAVLREALLDRSARVRSAARFHLDAHGPVDAAAFYRERIAEAGLRMPAVIAGLGETGTAADADLVRTCLTDARPTVRTAAVGAMARLADAQEVEVFLAALVDPSARVSRRAAEALRPRIGWVPRAALAPRMAETQPAHVRRNAFRLLASGSRWDSIGWILRGCAGPDASLARTAQDHLRGWRDGLNRTAAPPTEEQKSAARAALHEAGEHVPPLMRDWLLFVLR
ncbi:MAG TPA: hypothetical protein VF665_04085 [Longimicrobium sp.]|jgi:hypothetical protein|uniref:hypothetical protein n=1 Tax=Longimicrobium sp. TaxID=2029185 RepID=UPI002EDB7B66